MQGSQTLSGPKAGRCQPSYRAGGQERAGATNQPAQKTCPGRLLLASPPGFACAGARAGRRAAGMTQLRLSTLEPHLTSNPAGRLVSSSSSERFFLSLFLSRLASSRRPSPLPTSRTTPKAGKCNIADLVPGQKAAAFPRPCVARSRGTGDCQTAGMQGKKNPAGLGEHFDDSNDNPDDWI